ncbi:MAG: TetR/AcrR family transcriptional regulator [Syntrophaceae bacterium]
MNRREASKAETRRLVLEAARELFSQKGMQECTIRDIAGKAGVSPASVLVHYKSKTALLEEALVGDIRDALSGLIASIPAGAGLLDRLMHLSKGMLRFYDRDRGLYRALVRLTIFEPVSETPGMTKQSEEYVRFLSEMVEAEKTSGVIRQDVDSMFVAASIFFFYLGALTMLFRMPEMSVETVADMLSSMTAQYLEGIAGGHP